MVCIFLPLAIAICGYSINLVYMELVRTEMQIATDAATRAATRSLIVTGDQAQAIRAADHMLAMNPCGEERMPLSATKIEFGVSTRTASSERFSYNAGGKQPNAVRIDGTRTFKIEPLFPTLGVPIDFRPVKSAIATQTEVDIVLVLDRSGSMAYGINEVAGKTLPSCAPSTWAFGQPVPSCARWLDAVRAVEQLLQMLQASYQHERLALCTYSTTAKVDVPLSESTGEASRVLNQYSASFWGGSTNIGDGILLGAATLGNKKYSRAWASRVMIILTDGIATVGSDPLMAAQLAASEQIAIHTITFSNEADVNKMQQVASIGKGKHYHALSGAEVVAAFKDITTRLPILLTQ